MQPVTSIDSARPKALEFFAGIGLARRGLESTGFRVTWANDYETKKLEIYEKNYVPTLDHQFVLGDISDVSGKDLPQGASLAWASSPCTDLSLAGTRAGLAGKQSGTFWHFVRILEELGEGKPPVVVLENVVGLATSHGGDDLAEAICAFNRLGYSVDVLSIDARRFTPQSRPRLFLIGALNPPADVAEPNSELRPDWLQWVFGDDRLITHRAELPTAPAPLLEGFGKITEQIEETDERWWNTERTKKFIDSLSSTQLERVTEMKCSSGIKYRTAYRRTRNGKPTWEVRADDIAGCLRTARGGSSKQAVVRLGNNQLRVRWMTPLEYARLMGAGDYDLSGLKDNQILFGFGDAVVVPVVEWLAENYLVPLVNQSSQAKSMDFRKVKNG